MCEPIVLAGGPASRGIMFAGTNLTVAEHQRRTVANFIKLRKLLGERVIPVLQGWSIADYWRCGDLCKKAGIRLADEATVGIGSVCRRQSTAEATTIKTTLAPHSLRRYVIWFQKGRPEELPQAHDERRLHGVERHRAAESDCLPQHHLPNDPKRRGRRDTRTARIVLNGL